MSRLKTDYENKLGRKRRRNMTFDSYRDFDNVSSDHCILREVLQLFHNILIDLSKCILYSETELNAIIKDEVEHVLLNNRTLIENSYSNNINVPQLSSLINVSLNSTKYMRLIPYLNSLLKTVKDPCLLRFICGTVCDSVDNFDLKNCLDRLKMEATYLIKCYKGFMECKNLKRAVDEKREDVTNHDLRLGGHQKENNIESNSLNEQYLTICAEDQQICNGQASCPFLPDLSNILHNTKNPYIPTSKNPELNRQRSDLKYAFVQDATSLKIKNDIKYTTARNERESVALDTFAKLQATARNILSTPIIYKDHNAVIVLLQVIDDFCREGDTIVERIKKYRDDLQSQIDAADKQLKSTRQFLEEQAEDREQERDDFILEIKSLENQLRNKEKEIYSLQKDTQKLTFFEDQNCELKQKLMDSNKARDKFEIELKASIDKIFVLREIISELENQIEAHSLNKIDLNDKIAQLEDLVKTCNIVNDKLQMEVECLKTEITKNYMVKIQLLEQKLGNVCPRSEQNMILEKLVKQLSDIENALDQKTRTLELLHQYNSSNSCSEDVSAQCLRPLLEESITKSWISNTENEPSGQLSLIMHSVEKIFEKLAKHSLIEESIIKCLKDKDMQIMQIRNSSIVLRHEKDSLQERVLEQAQRISSIQLRLDEQRQRNEEVQTAGISNLKIQIHDLKTEVQNLSETLELRNKQIHAINDQLKKSKITIDKLEGELSNELKPQISIINRLESEVKQKNLDIQILKDRIKTEMINKLALPDLMETMLADKNEEIDHLKEKLVIIEREHKSYAELGNSNSSVKKKYIKCDQTVSDIVSISEFDEPDVVRHSVAHNLILSSSSLNSKNSKDLLQTQLDSSNKNILNSIKYHTGNIYTLESPKTFEYQHFYKDPIVIPNMPSVIPALVPRQINFSVLINDSKLYNSGKKTKTPETILDQEFNKKNVEEQIFNLPNIEEHNIELKSKNKAINDFHAELTEKSYQIEHLLHEKKKLVEDNQKKKYLLSKAETHLFNYHKNEEKYTKRIADLQNKMFLQIKCNISDREKLRRELQRLSEIHANVLKESGDSKNKIAKLQQEITIKCENLKSLTSKFCISEKTIDDLKTLVKKLKDEIEILRQQNSENNSKQFSVDDIAKEVEKELIYAAQLDSNILQAITSKEETKIVFKKSDKNYILNCNDSVDDNIKKEGGLLNELQSLKSRDVLQSEHNEDIRNELIAVKQESQEIQEEDMLFIEAMRNCLETAVEKEKDFQKILDIERNLSVQLKSRLAKLQHLETGLNIYHQLQKSHWKILLNFGECESEYVDHLRQQLKLFKSHYT